MRFVFPHNKNFGLGARKLYFDAQIAQRAETNPAAVGSAALPDSANTVAEICNQFHGGFSSEWIFDAILIF